MSDAHIKDLMKRLGESINEALSESPRICERVQEIRDAGYEIYLVIEAKIGFSPNGETDRRPIDVPSEEAPVRLRINSDDVKFLKSLKISAE